MARKKTLTFTDENMFWISEALLRLMDNPSNRRIYVDRVYVYAQCQDLLNMIKKNGYLQFRYGFDAKILRPTYLIKMAEMLRNHERTDLWMNPTPSPPKKKQRIRIGKFPHYDPDDVKKKKKKTKHA